MIKWKKKKNGVWWRGQGGGRTVVKRRGWGGGGGKKAREMRKTFGKKTFKSREPAKTKIFEKMLEGQKKERRGGNPRKKSNGGGKEGWRGTGGITEGKVSLLKRWGGKKGKCGRKKKGT